MSISDKLEQARNLNDIVKAARESSVQEGGAKGVKNVLRSKAGEALKESLSQVAAKATGETDAQHGWEAAAAALAALRPAEAGEGATVEERNRASKVAASKKDSLPIVTDETIPNEARTLLGAGPSDDEMRKFIPIFDKLTK